MRSLKCPNMLAVLMLASMTPFASAQVVPSIATSPDSALPPPAILPPSVAPPLRPLTLQEFAAAFNKPLPGKYEVMLIHPKKGCPVKVCFTLPPGCIRKVRVTEHKIVFDYKCQRDVVIRFLCCGKVWVRGG
jgi:hypothetical protein